MHIHKSYSQVLGKELATEPSSLSAPSNPSRPLHWYLGLGFRSTPGLLSQPEDLGRTSPRTPCYVQVHGRASPESCSDYALRYMSRGQNYRYCTVVRRVVQ